MSENNSYDGLPPIDMTDDYALASLPELPPYWQGQVEAYRRENVTANVLAEVLQERRRQHGLWGEQNPPDYPDGVDKGWAQTDYAHAADAWKDTNAERVRDDDLGWDGILLEEVYEALAESNPAKLRAELVQVAAVAVAWIEAIDRRAK